jgi:hypothetical protein
VTSLGLSRRHSHLNSSSNKNSKASSRHKLPITTEISCRPTTSKRPNKVSERIFCLVCIFIRLPRSSRVAELEKSAGNSATGSFRMDMGLNVATGGTIVASSSNRGQQDHYGVFGIHYAIVRDVGPYKNLVRFTSSSFDPRGGFSGSPLLTKVRGVLEALQHVDLLVLNQQQKLAFWLNIYNTCIMHGTLQHGLTLLTLESCLHSKNKATITVSGQMSNALAIENFTLRQQPSSVEEFWGDVRSMWKNRR